MALRRINPLRRGSVLSFSHCRAAFRIRFWNWKDRRRGLATATADEPERSTGSSWSRRLSNASMLTPSKLLLRSKDAMAELLRLATPSAVTVVMSSTSSEDVWSKLLLRGLKESLATRQTAGILPRKAPVERPQGTTLEPGHLEATAIFLRWGRANQLRDLRYSLRPESNTSTGSMDVCVRNALIWCPLVHFEAACYRGTMKAAATSTAVFCMHSYLGYDDAFSAVQPCKLLQCSAFSPVRQVLKMKERAPRCLDNKAENHTLSRWYTTDIKQVTGCFGQLETRRILCRRSGCVSLRSAKEAPLWQSQDTQLKRRSSLPASFLMGYMAVSGAQPY